ncbi:hypothetical protein [Streptomyces sp. NPDC002763]|uniref:hypothetical protein n=1 Tax=Streptomyces sp. NPDC002763 TaxID=3154427 RepID=UPI00332F3AAA
MRKAVQEREKRSTSVTYRDCAGSPAGRSIGKGGCSDTPCQILPALTLGYRLTSDNNNTSDQLIQTMRLDVGHVSYDGAGPHSRITSAKVSVSYDGGTTWKPALVVGLNGTYQAAWLNPVSAHGTSPAIKVTATDAAGGSITQTITSAYTIAASGGTR